MLYYRNSNGNDILHILQGPLPLDTSLLGERAMKCRAYAKALHYKEEDFHRGANTQILESLIRYLLAVSVSVCSVTSYYY